MVYIVHHRADFDGFFSGLLAGMGVKRQMPNAQIYYVPYNYEDDVWIDKRNNVRLQDVVEYNDYVLFVDCSYTKDRKFYDEIIKKIGDPAQVIMIDHHESAISWVKENAHEIEFSHSESSSDPNVEYPKSAARLVWDTFFHPINVPKIIELVSEYDVWYKKDIEKWNNEILPFQYGMRNKGIDMFKVSDYFDEFENLIEHAGEKCEVEYVEKAIVDGKAVIDYNKSRAKMVTRSTGFEAFLDLDDTTYSAYFAADYCANSTLFEWGLKEEDQKKYDLFVLCRPVIGEKRSYISIISNRDDIDASKIAVKYGGGGHAKIAGCVVYVNKTRIEEDDETRVTFEEYEAPHLPSMKND